MEKKLLILIYIIYANLLFAQNEQKRDYVWIRGYDQNAIEPGGEGTLLNFNGGNVSFEFLAKDMEMRFMNASICDSLGNLLFYSNGCYIADASHQMMENGDSLNYPGEIYDNNCGNGNGYTVANGATILPHPDSSNIYYLFHVKKTFHVVSPNNFELFGYPLLYTKVDMSKNNGLGAVAEKNQIAIADTLHQQHLEAVKHANGKDWWILIPKEQSNVHLSVLLNSDGISNVFEQEIGDAQLSEGDGVGQAAFSPDGTKYAKYDYKSQLYVYDFDRNTGQLSNFQKLIIEDSTSLGGLAFSPNSRFIYVASPSKVHQFDIWSSDIQASKILVAEWDGFSDGIHPVSFYQMQLGPDCRIYLNTPSSCRYMHVIMNPDLPGTECDLRQHYIMTPSWVSRSLPNFPNYRLGVTPSYPCDSTINLETMVAINDVIIEKNKIRVFPNPTSGELHLKFQEGIEGEIILYNSIGQQVFQKDIFKDELNYEWYLNQLGIGVYFFTILSESTIVKCGKIVKLD
ncbi:MAG: hypothetical protein ACI8YQ_005024 [Polaribacter sp.]|jgi:hypothetical protein